MKKISIHKTQYRLNWYRIVLFSVAIVLTGIYSITAKGQTVAPLTVNASVGAPDNQSIALTITSVNTGKSTGLGTSNIKDSGIANQNILVTEANSESKTLGNTDVYSSISTSPYTGAQPVTSSEAGEIESISIYHNGGTGNMILGVYSSYYSQPTFPYKLLGVSESTPINTNEGWQTLSLLSPVEVLPGQMIYLSWLFENNPGIRYTSGKPGIVKSWVTWIYGIQDYFANSKLIDSVYSVYCTYKPELYYLGVVTAIGPGYHAPNQVSMDYLGNSTIFKIVSNTSWIIKSDASWLNLSQVSGSNTATISLTSNSVNAGKDRLATLTISGTGVADKTITVVQEHLDNSTGNYDVYDSTSTSEYLTAQPVTFDEPGEIETIRIYHNGGTGNVVLGVYSDKDGSPSSLLGVSDPEPVNSMGGWQYIYLKDRVKVNLGQTVWLSWIFESNPGVRYTTGAPTAAKSTSKWSEGMPNTIGITANEVFKYSIFCEYRAYDPTLYTSTINISLGYNSGSKGTFDIISNTNWHIRKIEGEDWFDFSPTEGSKNGTITVTANSPNTGTSSRTATFMIGWRVAYKIITVTQESQTQTSKILGNNGVYSLISTLAYRKAQPISFNESGEIESISIYHNGGTGKLLLAVYSDQAGSPSALMGVTESTPVNTDEGWQTVLLTNPVIVTSGQTVWLSWLFENNPGIRYTNGTPGRIKSMETWPEGMPETFGTGVYADYIYSVYCTYKPSNSTPTLTVSTEIISLGYSSGSSGTVNITSNTNWSISKDVSWLDVSPASGSNNGVITLTANSANTGTSPRTATVTISGTGVADKTLTVTQVNQVINIGNTDVYSLISTLPYRKAQPITFNESGEIKSISIYHNGGTGNVLMGVYADQAGSPSSLLGVTATTPINTAEGWQSVSLKSPVTVFIDQTVWLSWVFQNNPGLRYTSGRPRRIKSTETWPEGMPAIFGTGTYANYIYSVYCTYLPLNNPDYRDPVISQFDSTTFTSVNLNKDEFLIFPNPTTGNLTVKWNNSNHESLILTIYNALGQEVKKVQTEPGINEIPVDLSNVKKGIYMVELKESRNGTTLSRSKIVKN
jgi:hypothetical protein